MNRFLKARVRDTQLRVSPIPQTGLIKTGPYRIVKCENSEEDELREFHSDEKVESYQTEKTQEEQTR